MKKRIPQFETYGEAQTSAFGLEILRTMVIPELLGDETHSILYWSGRKLARHYLVEQLSELPLFFERAGWGELEFKEEKKESCLILLTSELVEARIKSDEKNTFSLEAGFLAEQFEHLKKCSTEAFTEVKSGRNKKYVEIHVQWDLKDPIRIPPQDV